MPNYGKHIISELHILKMKMLPQEKFKSCYHNSQKTDYQ